MTYPGQKNIPGVIQKIINEIPRHNHYYEIFAGTGAIGQHLPFSKSKHYNDLNKTILQAINEPSGNTVIKTSRAATDIIQLLTTAGTDTFIFCDPPYLHLTRNNNKLYEHEMTVLDHIDFIAAVKLLKCNCMIIHPACELYEQLLQSWRNITLKIRYHKKTSIENLYMNYHKQELHTYRYIGKDCWQRQGFKRKAHRHLKLSIPIPFQENTYITDML